MRPESRTPSPASLLARCRFPGAPGAQLACAVSGGADSVALLALAVSRASDPGLVTAIHVDHGLRLESGDEAAAVAAIATELGARFVSATVAVAIGANLEERARVARYDALPAGVCTGHTADDLAETVLINLMRGAGVDGLSAMARPNAAGPVRPILGLRRDETQALCAALGLATLRDPMNADPRFVRVRVRHEVLPLLADVAGRDVAAVLARQASLLADDAELLDSLARSLDPTDGRALGSAPVALARRAVRAWLVAAGVADGHPPDADAVARVLAVARGEAKGADLVGGWRVRRTNQVLRLERS